MNKKLVLDLASLLFLTIPMAAWLVLLMAALQGAPYDNFEVILNFNRYNEAILEVVLMIVVIIIYPFTLIRVRDIIHRSN